MRMDQRQMPLYNALIGFTEKEHYSLHVPGHKNGRVFPKPALKTFQDILSIDLTELEGLDDLHSPSGVIKEAQSLLTDYYQTKQSFFLVNGSTVGNLTMVLACCSPGDLVFVQRNAHKSIFNALKLAQVQAVFLTPETDEEGSVATGLTLETLQEALNRYPEAKALILTYPNYYGQAVQVETLIQIAHTHGLGVLVDEAHGPHFKWGEPFPKSSLEFGADLVVHSAHKMLPAMTMGAYLHINSDWIAKERVQAVLSMLQSSSPSYPIMASLDVARSFLATLDEKSVDQIVNQVTWFKRELESTLGWSLGLSAPFVQTDPLKLMIHVSGYSGFQLKTKIETMGYFPELADPNHVLFVFGLDQVPPFQGMLESFKMAGIQPKSGEGKLKGARAPYSVSPTPLGLSEFEAQPLTSIPLSEAVGYQSGAAVIPYPPGIPILLKGETITNQHIEHIELWKRTGAAFQGDEPFVEEDRIQVLCP